MVEEDQNESERKVGSLVVIDGLRMGIWVKEIIKPKPMLKPKQPKYIMKSSAASSSPSLLCIMMHR